MKRRNLHILCLTAWTALVAPAVMACVIFPPTKEEKLQARLDSKPVETSVSCAFKNAGLNDRVSAGPAIKLGEDRFYQDRNPGAGVASSVLLADCAAREVIGVRRFRNIVETSCLMFEAEWLPVLKPEGPLSLTEGETLSDFIDIAASADKNIEIDETLSWAFTDPWGRSLPQKDRVDLLCGCKIFYPDSAGANG